MYEQIDPQLSSFWHQLPAALRIQVSNTYLSTEDATQLSLTCRQSWFDYRQALIDRMKSRDVLSIIPKLHEDFIIALKALPLQWRADLVENIPESDLIARLGFVLLHRGPVFLLSVLLDILHPDRKKSDFSPSWIKIYAPWDWITLAAAFGSDRHLHYLLYRWQIQSLDMGEYQFKCEPMSSGPGYLARGYVATPLQIAVYQRHLSTINILLSYSDPNFRYENLAPSALVIAIEKDAVAIVKALVRRGANPNQLGVYHAQYNAYHQAIMLKRIEVLQCLRAECIIDVWQETDEFESSHDIIKQDESLREMHPFIYLNVSKWQQLGHALLAGLVMLCISPFLALAQSFCGVVRVVTKGWPDIIKTQGALAGSAIIFMTLLLMPLFLVLNMSLSALITPVMHAKAAWLYGSDVLCQGRAYVQSSAKALTAIPEALFLGQVPFSRVGSLLYVTHTAEYFYIAFGCIVTSTLTLLAVFHVFSPLMMLFPALKAWPAWHVIGLTAAAGSAVSAALCIIAEFLIDAMSDSVSSCDAEQRNQLPIHNVRLYTGLSKSAHQESGDIEQVSDAVLTSPISVYHRAPNLKQQADGALVSYDFFSV